MLESVHCCCFSIQEVYKNVCDYFSVSQMSQHVVLYLNPYRRPDCKEGRIMSTEDFKHLARRVSVDIHIGLIVFPQM